MTKMSLVQLSQMENKPKKLKFKNTEFTLQTSSCYVDKFKVGLDNYIYFEEFNEPLIEIVEETILTDDEKEFLKLYTKLINDTDFGIRKLDSWYIAFYFNEVETFEVYMNDKNFKNLEIGKYYKISDLGLYDEE